MVSERIRICIIGAGAAGLCAARHAKRAGLLPVVYESNKVIGGTWVYTDKIGNNVHSSMYKNMFTNLPKEVMAFPDYPFSEVKTPGRSFLHHTEVLEYLEDYARQFDLLRLIRFRTKVLEVKRKEFEGKWEVTIEHLDDNASNVTHRETHDFDGIMVCSGHYSVPKFPCITGLSQFKGIQMHSHSYKVPEFFNGRTVLTIGAGASGQDISLEISEKAKKVYLSHNGKVFFSKLPSNMETVTQVASCSGEWSFSLLDGKRLDDVDILFWATGYQHSYPFLQENCKISVSSVVRPLYKTLINASYPTMCFIGIPFVVCPFPLFDRQAQFYVQCFKGYVKLPSVETMIKEEEDKFKLHMSNSAKERYYHKFGNAQWTYNDELARMGNFPPLAQHIERIYEAVSRKRSTSVTTYKQDCYADWIEKSRL